MNIVCRKCNSLLMFRCSLVHSTKPIYLAGVDAKESVTKLTDPPDTILWQCECRHTEMRQSIAQAKSFFTPKQFNDLMVKAYERARTEAITPELKIFEEDLEGSRWEI